jgi:hypothetical protein
MPDEANCSNDVNGSLIQSIEEKERNLAIRSSRKGRDRMNDTILRKKGIVMAKQGQYDPPKTELQHPTETSRKKSRNFF